MNSFNVYKTYLALKLHFTTDTYDVFEKQGRVRASAKSFNTRKDLFSIEKISKKYSDAEIVDFLVSNFITGDRWGGVFDASAHETYLTWLGRQERLAYQFNEDLLYLCNHSTKWSDLLDCRKTSHPYIIRAFLGNHICIETLTILDVLSGKQITGLDLNDTIVWPALKRIVTKYAPFLRFDDQKFRSVFGQRFTDASNDSVRTSGTATARDYNTDAGSVLKSNSAYSRDPKIFDKISSKPPSTFQTGQSVALSDYFI
ncbi:MAG: hypothetical protein EBY07_15090 [Actinobacteria bacterium]|jgi:T4 gene Gp59 loader of gp41 DNA helicase|nr:hypothetical protein [Actinomycetota bacterium]